MPEGPECHAIALRLNAKFAGKNLRNIVILGGRYKKCGPFEGLTQLIVKLGEAPITIERVGAKGKLIYFVLGDGTVILNTLGLSGGWTGLLQKHCGVCFDFGRNKLLWFKDQLHYGTLRITDQSGLQKKLDQLGCDVTLGTHMLSEERWQTICQKNKSWSIAKLLMCQKKVSGIGNYLKAETLYAAGVAPESVVGDIPIESLQRIYKAITTIPNKAFRYKIKKIRGYLSEDDHPEPYKLKVYGKKTDPEGNPVTRTKTTDGRVSHWVSKVQTMFQNSSFTPPTHH